MGYGPRVTHWCSIYPQYCHNLFPVLSPIDHICSVSLGLTPFFPYPALQVTLISPDHTQLCLRVPFSLVHSQEPEPSLGCTPSASGMPRPSKITWSSCDNHATTHNSCHIVSRPLSQWTWDLRGPTLFIFQSISILLHAYTALIAPQCSYAYLFLILTWRLIVCMLCPVTLT